MMRKDNVFFAVMQKNSDFFIVFRPKLKRIKFPVPAIRVPAIRDIDMSTSRFYLQGLKYKVHYYSYIEYDN